MDARVPQAKQGARDAKANSLSGQASSVAMGRIASSVITALSMILLARAVEPTDFGRFSVALVAAAFICVTLDQGLETLTTRASALKDLAEMQRANGTHALLMCTAVAFTPIVAVVSGSSLGLAAVIQVAAIGERRMSFWIGRLVGAGRSQSTVPLLVLGRIPPLFLIGAPYAFPTLSPLFVYSSLVLLGCSLSSFAGGQMARQDGVVGWSVDLKILRRSRPFWIASTIGQIRQLDLVALRYIASGSALSAYAPAARLIGPMKLLPSSLGAAIFPRAVGGHHTDVRKAMKFSWLAVPAATFLTILVWSFGQPVLSAVLGSEYADSWTPMALLAMSVCIGIPGAVASSALQGYGYQVYVARVEVLLLAVQIITLMALALSFGANGAAISVVVTSVVLTAVKSRKVSSILERHK